MITEAHQYPDIPPYNDLEREVIIPEIGVKYFPRDQYIERNGERRYLSVIQQKIVKLFARDIYGLVTKAEIKKAGWKNGDVSNGNIRMTLSALRTKFTFDNDRSLSIFSHISDVCNDGYIFINSKYKLEDEIYERIIKGQFKVPTIHIPEADLFLFPEFFAGLINSQIITFPEAEFRLVSFLAEKPYEVVTFSEIRQVYNFNSLDNFYPVISRLRTKLAEHQEYPVPLLVQARNASNESGYQFVR
jgi:DNA-binding winged helix-turn-helix (wHTH) protein